MKQLLLDSDLAGIGSSSVASAAAEVPSSISRPTRDRAEILLAAATAMVAVWLCVPAARSLAFIWGDLEYYAHGYALPATAAYLAYCNRREIRKALRDFQPPALGPIVVLSAAVFEVVTYMGDVLSAAGLGIPMVLGSVAYAIGGMRLVRPLRLPLVFLALMVPPPQFVFYELLFRLKLIVTQVSVSLLQSAGATVIAEGNQIMVPGYTLFVADACSGLNSIVTLVPIACIVAVFLSRGVWRRAAVIASVVPLAMGANIVRVAVTVYLVSYLGTDVAQGLLHDTFGVVTYAAGTLALVGVARTLR